MSESARPAVREDLPRLVTLGRAARAAVAGQRGGDLWSVREARPEPLDVALAAALADPDSRVVAGCYDDVVVGMATVHAERLRDGSLLGVLGELFVEPAARAVGVGEAMMDNVVAWCVERGCRGIDSVALPGDRETKNFFERFGLTARAIVVHRALTAPEHR